VRHVGNSVLVSAYTIISTVLLSTLAGAMACTLHFLGQQALFISWRWPLLMIPFRDDPVTSGAARP